MAATLYQQVGSLVKRNFLIKRRNIRQAVQEALFPIMYAVILVVIASLIPNTSYPAIPAFPAMDPVAMAINATGDLAFAPSSSLQVVSIMNNVLLSLGLDPSQLKPYDSADDLAAAYDAVNIDNLWAGVIFEVDSSGDIGSDVVYTIRQSASLVPSTFSLTSASTNCRNPSQPLTCPAYLYYINGFVRLQKTLDEAIIFENTGVTVTVDVQATQFPKEAYVNPNPIIATLSAIYLVFAFQMLVQFLIVNIVIEKELKFKQAMIMMGMRTSSFIISWFFTYAAIMVVTVLVVSIIVTAGGVMPNSNFFIVFLLMFLYCLSMIALAFLISPFFKSAKVAGGVGSLIVALLSVIYVPLNGLSTPASASAKWGASLLAPVALSLGIGEAVLLEATGTGTRFSNINTGYSTPGYSVSSSLIMLVVDIFLYLLISWYFDNVLPTEDSVSLGPFFFLRKSFWLPTRTADNIAHEAMRTVPHNDDEEPVYVAPGSIRTGIEISNLTKVFPPLNRLHSTQSTRALNDMNLQMDKGQIFGLLGHNGAGKSTLVSILCGMSMPTSGSARIFGLDSVADAALVRPMMGVCLQTNILFDQLTVREHLQIVAGIKGVPTAQINALVERLIVDIDLVEQATTRSIGLSGGQKRKLCVGMALVGNPAILVLDEPTSGMDPYSRRKLWDLLLREKKDRVTLLTTHFMDEADVLTDRKAILSHGHVRCSGSSLFLKTRFGLGYLLTVITPQETNHQETAASLRALITDMIKGAELTRDVGREVVFRLPLKSSPLFGDLFDTLDARKASLGFSDYTVSMTTLEEVFVRLEHDETASSLAQSSGHKEEKVLTYSPFHVDMTRDYAGQVNEKEQLSLLTRYRFLASIRQPATVIFMTLVPAIFVIIGLSIYKFIPTTDSTQSLLDLATTSLFPASAPIHVVNNTDVPLDTWLPLFPFNTTIQAPDAFVQNLVGSDTAAAYNFTTLENGHVTMNIFNDDTQVHAFPSYFGAAMSALASNLTAGLTTITAQTFPFNADLFVFDSLAYIGIYLIGNSLAFLPGAFAVDIVKDRQKKLKHQLVVSGASRLTYWLSLLIRCCANFLVSGLLVIILILAFQLTSLTGLAILPVIIIIVIYIPMILLFIFLCTFFFSSWETAQSVLPPLINFVGIIPYFVVAGLDQSGLRDTARILHYVFLAVDPPYSIMGGLYFVNRIYTFSMIFGTDITMADYFKTSNDVLPTILIMLAQVLLFGGALYFKEVYERPVPLTPASPLLSRDSRVYGALQDQNVHVEGHVEGKVTDPGVIAECQKAARADFVSTHPIVAKELVRTVEVEDTSAPIVAQPASFGLVGVVRRILSFYGVGNTPKTPMIRKNIVNHVTFGVSAGECLGLLGPNGAGKTTTMSIITADMKADGGVAYLCGHDVATEHHEAMQRLGYCPQFDALFDEMTPREHLVLYSSLKGVPIEETRSRAAAFLKGLGLDEYADRQVKKLSGGTKRKVSFAIAMIGNPSVVILDEPSTGMDPSSKRFLWDVILDHLKGRASILTTHSMDEAEALCSRIAIMVNGRVECLGTAQSLRHLYGDGFLLELSVQADRADDARAMVTRLFPGATLVEGWGGHLSYKVAQKEIPLSQIFRALEECKTTLNVEEYSFSQTTLEQVFVAFAKKQHADTV